MLVPVADFGETAVDFGEDAAAVFYKDEYLLLAADGIWGTLIDANPYGAGKASVMASVNDIYAMGGRPIAMVNVMGIPGDDRFYSEIVSGIRKGCEKFRVPMIGGHLHPDTGEASLSVAILGAAKRLLRSTNAQPGQDIIFAVDLEGKGFQCSPVISWDTNSGKTSSQVLDRLEVLPLLAEKHNCCTCKDVSNAGLLGTIAMLLETSQAGAHITLDNIPVPECFDIIDWLKAFLSYGFVLCADPEDTETVTSMFSQKHITAASIGKITYERQMTIELKGSTGLLFDFESEDITGIAV